MKLQKAKDLSMMKMKQRIMIQISVCLLFIGTMLSSARAHATVFTGSFMTSMAALADVLNPILEMVSLLVTITLGITTIILYRIKIKKQDKK